MRRRVDFFDAILMWFIAVSVGVMIGMSCGCAAPLTMKRERVLACDEACECIAYKTEKMRQWSSYDGETDDTCTCWVMDSSGNQTYVTVPRHAPPGLCD